MGTRRAVVGFLVSALLAVSIGVAAPSHALVVFGAGPSLNDGMVGQTVPDGLQLANSSTAPDNVPAAFTAIDLYPACTNGANDCVRGPPTPTSSR